MGRSIPLFLTRMAAILVAGLLLFAVFGHAHAADSENYGLKRFPGDNYDTVPARPSGAFAPPPVAPAPQTYSPVSAEPYGYNATAAQPAYPAPRLSVAPQADPYAYYQGAPSYEYVLGSGDKLRLNVFGEGDLSGEFTIDGAGYIRLPLIGDIRAAGYTAQQLQGAIANALSRGYLKAPRVAVEVATYRPFYIIGAVNRPGQYAYVDHMNALNAIALAGGFQSTAVESVVFVRREGSNEEIKLPADRSTDIRPGDVVKVHTTIFSDAVTFLSPFSGVAASAATAAVIQ